MMTMKVYATWRLMAKSAKNGIAVALRALAWPWLNPVYVNINTTVLAKWSKEGAHHRSLVGLDWLYPYLVLMVLVECGSHLT